MCEELIFNLRFKMLVYVLGHVLVRIKRPVAISEEFCSPPVPIVVNPQLRLINNNNN